MRRHFKYYPHHKILRILTLACFFHFSGLNNGFTTLVVCAGLPADGAGQIQRLDVAPLLARNFVAAFHTLRWKRIALDSLRLRLFPKSARVIEHASQIAVRSALIESSHMQIWLVAGLKSCISAQPKCGFSRPDKIRHPAMSLSYPSRLGSQSYKTRAAPGYLQGDRKEPWFKSRTHLWNGHKKTGSGVWGLGSGYTLKYLNKTGDPPLQDHRLKFSIRIVPDKLRIWFTSSLSRDGGDLCRLHRFVVLNEITLINRQGDFSFPQPPVPSPETRRYL